MPHMRHSWLTVAALTAMLFEAEFAAEEAKGTLAFKAKAKDYAVELKYAYLIKVPDALNPKEMVRRVVFTPGDIGPDIKACTVAGCVDGSLSDGLHVDLSTPFLPYWMVLNDQRVQHSGPADLAALKLTTDTPTRVAGKLTFDATKGGGPKVDVTFDAVLLKEFPNR
jgi:hypothetical protein